MCIHYTHIHRNDAKTVNVIATACFSPISRLVSTALKFFLSDGQDGGADEESSDSEVGFSILYSLVRLGFLGYWFTQVYLYVSFHWYTV